MNPQRQQAYFNLIQELRNCTSNTYLEILQANQDYIFDTGFLQTLEVAIDILLKREDKNGANRLRQIAQFLKITQLLKKNAKFLQVGDNTESLLDTYFQFLMEILRTTADNRGNVQVIYLLLAKNTDKLDELFAEILWQWGTNRLKEVEADEAKLLATVIVIFSNLIAQFPSDNKANNMEIAITGYKVALTVYNQQVFSLDWAMTLNNLGNAYINRILDERAKNLEQAIACFQNALKVYTFDAFPDKWAMTLNNLATAYIDRIVGEQAENFEQAIACLQEALKVYTSEDFPLDWARTQTNLGGAYSKRIKGQKAENLQQAIACLLEALKVYTFDAFPYEWARTQHNLGLAYMSRIREGCFEHLEQAITCLQEALTVRTFETFPYEWANTQNNLGIIYFDIGNIYRDIIRGKEAENLAQENLEQALISFQKALKVYNFEAFPLDWAITQNNLANVYSKRIKGKRVDNLERAISCLQKVLKFYTFEAFPQNHTEVLLNLGTSYQEAEQFDLAYAILKSAITKVEFLRSEIVSGEESKRKQAEYFHQVYGRIVQVSLELGNITEAIEYVERSKTRNLVELILERDSKAIFPPEVVTQLEKYKVQIATEQYQIQNGKAENLQNTVQHLQELRQQRNELQNCYLRIGADFNFDSFQATLDERTVIIEWYILKNKILAFILTPKGKITVWQSQAEDFKAFCDWIDKYLQDYKNQKEQWQNNLEEELKKLASFLHIDEILAQIPKSCDRLILIPHRDLHLFPLHALPIASQTSENSACLLDLFANGVSYAPSCQILQQVQQRERPNFQSLFAIQNPTEDLDYADLEVDSILNLFSSHQVLPYKQATKATLLQQMPQIKEANYLHFSCHGSFNFKSPQDSCLLLAESVDEKKYLDLSKCLTLSNLFEREFQLDNCRLVILSACETGLIDFTNISDEYIGLPSGFLYAGSTSVVSSLWAVNDLSTAFLMIQFMHNLQATMADSGDFSIAVELQKAQLWLRDVITEELQTWISQLKLSPKQAEKIYDYLDLFDSDEKPFQNPAYWAAFCATGQ